MNRIFGNAILKVDFSDFFKPRSWTFMYRIKFGTTNLKKVKIPILMSLFLLISINAYAIIPIYCPECKTHLYDYQYSEITIGFPLYAKDFKPTSDDTRQPDEKDRMNCPICDSPLNGWEYQGRKYKSFTNMCGAISMLTKDDLGFKWIPYDVPGTEYTRE